MLDDYIVLDIETTGLSKNFHKITEIAAIRFQNNRAIGKFDTLINPETYIPEFITKLTGITNEMVVDKPTIKQVIPKLCDFLGESTIVAHNASFDYGFIEYNIYKHHKINIVNPKLCTRKLANRILPNLSNKKLATLCPFFNIQNEQAHRAMSDVKATAQVFDCFLKILKYNGIKTKDDLIKFEKSSRKSMTVSLNFED